MDDLSKRDKFWGAIAILLMIVLLSLFFELPEDLEPNEFAKGLLALFVSCFIPIVVLNHFAAHKENDNSIVITIFYFIGCIASLLYGYFFT